MKYVLDHFLGKGGFDTLDDCVFAMFIIYQYNDEHDVDFSLIDIHLEIERIKEIVKKEGCYMNGFFNIYSTDSFDNSINHWRRNGDRHFEIRDKRKI